jgi:hypothetical protein
MNAEILQLIAPASEPYHGIDSSSLLSFSTSYSRQPDAVTSDFVNHGPGVHTQSDSSLQPAASRVPYLQDDNVFVEIGSSLP